MYLIAFNATKLKIDKGEAERPLINQRDVLFVNLSHLKRIFIIEELIRIISQKVRYSCQKGEIGVVI